MIAQRSPSPFPPPRRVATTITDEQLFLGFWDKTYSKALEFGVDVKRADIDYYICWGSKQWLFRFDPECARHEGDEPQVNEAIAKIRATR